MKSYITSIGSAFPVYRYPQMEIAEFMAEAAEMNREERVRLMALYRATGINFRHTVIPDFGRRNGAYTFFPNTPNLEPFPSVSDRMRLYEKEALPLALNAINNCLERSSVQKDSITHIITVSCTGMYAPGLDIEIAEVLQLPGNVRRTCINYMGCYAAFNALKAADAFCKAEDNATVLIVCVELCTIHYQKTKDWDYILSNALFGDGAAAVLVQSRPGDQLCISLESFFCDIAYEGKNDMAWNISDFGFEMTLSSYVPSLIKNGIKTLAGNLMKQVSASSSAIDYYAIHPGGKRILEVIEEELSISHEKMNYSYEVLKERGNMSSPTVLLVLEKIFHTMKESDANKTILSFAFGPGLTLESMMMKIYPGNARPERTHHHSHSLLNIE